MRLGDCVRVRKGTKPIEIFAGPSEGARRLLQIDDLRSAENPKFCPAVAKEVAVQPDDVVIAWDGANAGTSSWGLSGVAGSTLAVLTPTVAGLHTPYLGHFIRSKETFLRDRTKGATVPHLDGRVLADLDVPKLDIDRQRRIAAILDKADALRAKRREAIAKLDQLLQSVFVDMFGDPRLNPRGFPLRQLSEFYINPDEGTRCGPFGSALKRSDVTDSGVPLWNMDNISNTGQMQLPFRAWVSEEKARELAGYAVLDGDILISRAGTVGKMCVARAGVKASLITTNLIRLRLGPELAPEFFVALMTHCKGRVGRLKTGPDGAFTHMSTGVLDALSFPCPSIDQQRSWVDRSAAIQKQRARLSGHLDLMNRQFESMAKRMFSGVALT